MDLLLLLETDSLFFVSSFLRYLVNKFYYLPFLGIYTDKFISKILFEDDELELELELELEDDL